MHRIGYLKAGINTEGYKVFVNKMFYVTTQTVLVHC